MMSDGSTPGAAPTPPGQPAAPRTFRAGDILCRVSDIADPGSKGPFVVVLGSEEGDEETEIFLVRSEGKVRAFVNVCPHRYLPLNWKDDSFLTLDKSRILCVVHAALFDTDTGDCLTMHAPDGLTPVAITIEGDDIRLVRPH
jgi:nitrite reductase/ring-hydroxylating ferredoxin subunit